MGENWLIPWLVGMPLGLAAVLGGSAVGWSSGAQGLAGIGAGLIGLIIHFLLDERDRRHGRPDRQPG